MVTPNPKDVPPGEVWVIEPPVGRTGEWVAVRNAPANPRPWRVVGTGPLGTTHLSDGEITLRHRLVPETDQALPEGHVMFDGREWRPLRDGEDPALDSEVYVIEDTHCLADANDAVKSGRHFARCTDHDCFSHVWVYSEDAARGYLVSRDLIRVPVEADATTPPSRERVRAAIAPHTCCGPDATDEIVDAVMGVLNTPPVAEDPDPVVWGIRESDVAAVRVRPTRLAWCVEEEIVAGADVDSVTLRSRLQYRLRSVARQAAVLRHIEAQEGTTDRLREIAGENADEATLAFLAADPRIAAALAGDDDE